NIYHLTKIEDFSGTYTAVGTGAVLAGGGNIATMRNQHGVVIDLTDTSQGSKIMLGLQGGKTSMEGTPPASTRNCPAPAGCRPLHPPAEAEQGWGGLHCIQGADARGEVV